MDTSFECFTIESSLFVKAGLQQHDNAAGIFRTDAEAFGEPMGLLLFEPKGQRLDGLNLQARQHTLLDQADEVEEAMIHHTDKDGAFTATDGNAFTLGMDR